MPQMFNGIGVKVSLARKPQMDRSDRSHMLHVCNIYHTWSIWMHLGCKDLNHAHFGVTRLGDKCLHLSALGQGIVPQDE